MRTHAINIFLKNLRNTNIKVISDLNPLIIKIDNRLYAFYIRQITSAYFKNRPDVSRIQLHDSPETKSLIQKNTPVYVLGYCSDYDVFITWTSNSLGKRLNVKKNVSLYSRFSLQKKAFKTQENVSITLKNGDIVEAFPTQLLSNKLDSFINNLNTRNRKRDTITDLELMLQQNPELSFAEALKLISANNTTFQAE